MTKAVQISAAIFLTLAIAYTCLCIAAGAVTLDPRLTDWPATAAWVQGVGTVGAVLAAIWLQGRLIDRQRAERQRSYRDLALAVMQDIRDMIESAETYRAAHGLSPDVSAQYARQLRTRQDLLLKIDHRDGAPKIIDLVLLISSQIEHMLALLDEGARSEKSISNQITFGDHLKEARGHLRKARIIYGLSPEAPDVLV